MIFHFFRFSQKLSIRFERDFLQLFFTILESYMCNGIKIVWLGCEKQPKLAQNWPKNTHFSIFRSRKKFSTTYAIVLFFFLPTFSRKFQISQKLSIRFSRNFAQSFYTQRGPCVCKGIKIVWLGCEKHSQN